MTHPLSDADIQAALEECANEPVHIPGTIQPYACMIAIIKGTDEIVCVSENSQEFLGQSPADLLGSRARDLFGAEAWHKVRNAVAPKSIARKGASAGSVTMNGVRYELRVSQSDQRHVIEIEPYQQNGLDAQDALKTLSYLMAQIQASETEERLFEITVNLAQLLAGYDRTLIYRFDKDFNGEVIAESKQSAMQTFLGLRFPHWDIPEQARAIMAKLPLRFISDASQTPVRLLADPQEPPLNTSLAHARGVSPVHMEYLRNMGSNATMTLSIMIEDKLWGMISFHHRKPRVPALGLREVLENFALVFSSKLMSLRQQTALKRIETLDRGFFESAAGASSVTALIPAAAPLVLSVLKSDGIAALSGDEIVTSGVVPDDEVLKELSALAVTDGADGVVSIESLAERFPHHDGKFGDAAGVLLFGVRPNRAICVFRKEIVRNIAWAGNPSKEVEKVADRVRLSPRGSFATFLEQVRERCEPWTDNDLYLIRHLRTALHAAERQEILDRLNRQQELMIGELNHRVRNILALVRSVSRQARRRYGSLDSYANAIENRIRALASAHDLTSGSFAAPVSMHSLIDMEFEPFGVVSDHRARITGPDWPMKPQVAPIFSLIVHELVTNAAKYGALSTPSGSVDVTIGTKNDACHMVWSEKGGPKVNRPNEVGFGMAMIERAVPHELGGTAQVFFETTGVRAEFVIPLGHFSLDDRMPFTIASRAIQPTVQLQLPAQMQEGDAFVLEDNFIIAAEMADQLRDMGVEEIFTCATVEDGLEHLLDVTPALAVLDVNLGQNVTSEAVALRLVELGVPFVFVTGYGEDVDLVPALQQAPRLTKPISTHEFLEAVTKMLNADATST